MADMSIDTVIPRAVESSTVASKGRREQVKTAGERLRQTRLRAGRSLADVAAATGLSRGFISKCERGLSSASLDSLLRWTASLDITVAALFDSVGNPSRLDTRRPFHHAVGVSEYLLSPTEENRFQVFEERIEPGASPDRRFWSVNADVALVYVMSGSLDVLFDHGTRVVKLEEGEALTYLPREPHRWFNPSKVAPSDIIIFNMPATF